MRDLLYTNMEDGMKNYNQTGYEGVTHTWDIIQLEVMFVFVWQLRVLYQHNTPSTCCED